MEERKNWVRGVGGGGGEMRSERDCVQLEA